MWTWRGQRRSQPARLQCIPVWGWGPQATYGEEPDDKCGAGHCNNDPHHSNFFKLYSHSKLTINILVWGTWPVVGSKSFFILMKVLRLKHLQLSTATLLWQNKPLHYLIAATMTLMTLHSVVIRVLCILGWVFLWVLAGGGWNTSKNIGFLWRAYSLRITTNHQPNIMSLPAGSRRAFEAQYNWRI